GRRLHELGHHGIVPRGDARRQLPPQPVGARGSTRSSAETGPRRPPEPPRRDESVDSSGQTRSSSSMRIALPRRILYFCCSSSTAVSIFSQYSFEFGHVVSVC